MRKFVASALIASGLLFAICWFATTPKPPENYTPRLSVALNVVDYRFFIKKCLVEESPYRPVSIAPRDACYPPLAYCLIKLFPLSSAGEACYVVFLVCGLLCGLVLYLFERHRHCLLLCLGAVVLTVPFASGPIKGNPSAWAGGAVLVYLAWYDSAELWKRMIAAVMLGFATALKITPALFGLLYLRGKLFGPQGWPKEEIFVSGMSFLVLFSVPFIFFGGPNEVGVWLENALANAQYYSREADFGLVPFFGLLDNWGSFVTLGVAAHLTTLTAIFLCLVSCFTDRLYLALTLIGVAMVFLCHHDYGAVYVLPAFACWVSEVRSDARVGWFENVLLLSESLCWFCVFQQILCIHSYRAIVTNNYICNCAITILGILSLTHVAVAYWTNKKGLSAIAVKSRA